MNKSIYWLIAALTASAGVAHAETFHVDVFEARTQATSATAPATDTTSRAEALAEAHLRRLSGLITLSIRQRAEQSGFAYAQAKARYDRLIASEQFPRLVAALERNPHLDVVGR